MSISKIQASNAVSFGAAQPKPEETEKKGIVEKVKENPKPLLIGLGALAAAGVAAVLIKKKCIDSKDAKKVAEAAKDVANDAAKAAKDAGKAIAQGAGEAGKKAGEVKDTAVAVCKKRVGDFAKAAFRKDTHQTAADFLRREAAKSVPTPALIASKRAF